MTKVDKLAAGVFLCYTKERQIGQWSNILPPANGKQGPAALTNNKQKNYDQIHADNKVQRSGIRITRKKYV